MEWWGGIGGMRRIVVAMAGYCVLLSGPVAAQDGQAAEDDRSASWFKSPRDGQLDVSGFIDQAYGFLPIVVPVTEPAVGYGAAAAVAFIDRRDADLGGAGKGEENRRPNISVIGGLATENGTQGVFAFDSRYWLDDRLQTQAGAIRTSVNLDYYGVGDQALRSRRETSYTLDLDALLLQGKYRPGEARIWLGLAYLLADTRASRDVARYLEGTGRNVRLGGLNASVTYDSRDNIFTPTRGQYLEASATRFDPDFGSDVSFWRKSVLGMQYVPVGSTLFLAFKESVSANDGNAPFYAKPFIAMRGVPAMRYLGDDVAQVEMEARWQFYQRFSLIGFAGAGRTANDFHGLSDSESVTARGLGLRYELAEKYGLHIGVDLAWGRDGPAVYVQYGSAWLRP